MLRKKAVALALSMLLPGAVSALGLGPLKAQSGLNQPFEGRIEILGAAAGDFDTLSIKLASPEAFERAGVLRDAVLLSLKFEIVETPAGNDYIRVSTRDPVREPFLNFLLELNWANGRLVREYTVLLDPPLYDPNSRAVASAPSGVPPAARPAPARSTASGSVAGGGVIGPVQGSDTTWSLASRYRPDAGVSVQRMMIALLRANPEAFTNDNINLLRRGSVLRMPSQAELDGVTQQEALAAVARQHQLWEEYRQGAAATAPPQPLSTPQPSAQPSAGDDEFEAALADAEKEERPGKSATQPSTAGDSARLKLVPPAAAPTTTPEQAAGAPAAGAAEPSDDGAHLAEDAAALAAESATAQAAATDELKSKLDEATEIIDLLQRQVEIKDDELARLQAKLAELETAKEDAPSAAAVPAAPSAAPEKTAPKSPPPASAVPPAAPIAAGPFDEWIPAHWRNAVPGGSATIVGVLGSLLVLLLALLGKAVVPRRGKEIKAGPRPAAPVVAVTAPASGPAAVDTAVEHSPAPAAASVEEEVDPFSSTLEASAEQLQSDPLEEVNVYLAYERFDQAEELVKKVVAQYPNEHKYKLRLLEIYYSANNKQAYERYARELLEAVGEQDPLWENALAMWAEMSPQRALFAEGAPEGAPPPSAERSSEFVDITGPGGEADDSTAAKATEDEGPLAATAVGLTNDYAGVDGSVLDFDLTTASPDGAGGESMIDLTAGEVDDASAMIDLTATVEQLEKEGHLAAAGAAADGQQAVVDSDGESSLTLDLPEETADLDRDTATGEVVDLLDITKTGDVAGALDLDADEPLLSVTANSLADTDAGATAPSAESSSPAEMSLDFDISDTVSPQLETGEGPGAGEGVAPDGASGDSAVDFDLDGFGLDLDLDAPADANEAAGAPSETADLTVEGDDFSLDLDVDAEAAAEADLALQNPDLELEVGDDLAATYGGTAGDEADLEFDLALQDTTDFSKLNVEDTLEIPKVGNEDGAGIAPPAESLEDLTRSMEASLAGLDLETEPAEADILDFDLGDLDSEGLDLDLNVGDDAGPSETLALEGEDVMLERTGMHTDKTVIMPRSDDIEYQSESDEVDTKLNLAKAYLELGDSDGARAILGEVVREGSPDQQREAQQLLGQLS